MHRQIGNKSDPRSGSRQPIDQPMELSASAHTYKMSRRAGGSTAAQVWEATLTQRR
jgi:hypothetical protein